jgi:hypothetical protein
MNVNGNFRDSTSNPEREIRAFRPDASKTLHHRAITGELPPKLLDDPHCHVMNLA